MGSNGIIGQACFTWASKLPGGGNGNGFVAFSPMLQEQARRFEGITKDVCGYVGSARLSCEQRAAYTPLGRITDGERSIAFRKTDGGEDAAQRSGRYIVHFLVGHAGDLPLSKVVNLPADVWLSSADVPLNAPIALEDLAAADLACGEVEQSTLDEHQIGAITEALDRFGDTGEVDISAWGQDATAVLLACLPAWVDQEATLVSQWADEGPVSLLRAGDRARAAWTARTTWEGVPAALLSAASAIARCTSREEVGAALRAAGSGAATTQALLREAVVTWLESGAQQLSWDQEKLILRDPAQTLGAMADEALSLPGGQAVDPLAVALLRRCQDDADAAAIAKALPVERRGALAYAASVPTLPVLLATLIWSAETGVPASIEVSHRPSPEAVAALVAAAVGDQSTLDALALALRTSAQREESFARAIVGEPQVDPDALFGIVLPRAARDDAELLSLLSMDPDRFTMWLRCPAPYQQTLSAVLARDARDGIWRLLSDLVRRGGKR